MYFIWCRKGWYQNQWKFKARIFVKTKYQLQAVTVKFWVVKTKSKKITLFLNNRFSLETVCICCSQNFCSSLNGERGRCLASTFSYINFFTCEKREWKNLWKMETWRRKDDKNSHGFWAGVLIMILKPWMLQRRRERERERERWVTGGCLICKANEQYTWWTTTTPLVIRPYKNHL